jgi:hypothetical protein
MMTKDAFLAEIDELREGVESGRIVGGLLAGCEESGGVKTGVAWIGGAGVAGPLLPLAFAVCALGTRVTESFCTQHVDKGPLSS